MKSKFLAVFVVLAFAMFTFSVNINSVSAMTKPGSTATTTTTVKGTKSTTKGTLPGDSSGLSFNCEAKISKGIASITKSTITIPNAFIKSFTSQIFGQVGASFGANKLVSKIVDLIKKKTGSMCSDMVPVIADPSGQETSADTKLDSIVGERSDYVVELQKISAKMDALTAAANSGTLESDEGEDLLTEFNDLQSDQLDILEDMDTEMTELTNDHAAMSGADVALGGGSSTSSPSCQVTITYVDPLAPTKAELDKLDDYQLCTPTPTGACCYKKCDAKVTVKNIDNVTEKETDNYTKYDACLPLNGVTATNRKVTYCCFK